MPIGNPQSEKRGGGAVSRRPRCSRFRDRVVASFRATPIVEGRMTSARWPSGVFRRQLYKRDRVKNRRLPRVGWEGVIGGEWWEPE